MLLNAALADVSRLRLLSLLRGGELCVCQLQGVLQTNQPKISRHLAYLRKAGLVAARQDGKWTHYRLNKLEARIEKILSAVLDALQNEPQTQADQQRLKLIGCAPAPLGRARLRPVNPLALSPGTSKSRRIKSA